jgi:hypothetical protein
MNELAESLDWTTANQRHLSATVDLVRALLEEHVARATGTSPQGTTSEAAREVLRQAAGALQAPSALDTLGDAFGLSAFERYVLALCAGIDVEGTFVHTVAKAQGDTRSVHPTFGLAMAALPDAHWSAITPAAPLRRWRMIEILHGDSLTSSPIRIDERVLHYLAGVHHLDDRVQSLVTSTQPWDYLPPSLHAIAHGVADVLARQSGSSTKTVILLHGQDRPGLLAVASQAGAELGLTLFVMSAADVPSSAVDRELLARLLEREAVLSRAHFLVDLDDADGPEVIRSALSFVEACGVPIVVASREPVRSGASTVGIFVERPTASEQRDLWRTTLGPVGSALNGWLDPVVSQFNLSLPAIKGASLQVLAQVERGEQTGSQPPGSPNSDHLAQILWEACREQARPRLEDLTQRITPVASWKDIVLPEPQLQTLNEVAAHVRHRLKVYDTWGFAAKSTRGLGISALFTGPSGTGKTMAAEVLALDLRLDLYRIDLSQVVSKYIGETEKNLRRVFDAAEEGGAILLFDEADALFGKRSEVKDSHDRYANIEVSYLLQRMESYRGLAILTTNMKSALDQAFLRRIRFVVQFPFPEAAQRAEIWRRVFPAETPNQGLDPERLARLGVAGGNIRNIAMNAAFLAANDGSPVSMGHLLRAARTEYAKLERPLTDAEVGGWI